MRFVGRPDELVLPSFSRWAGGGGVGGGGQSWTGASIFVRTPSSLRQGHACGCEHSEYKECCVVANFWLEAFVYYAAYNFL